MGLVIKGDFETEVGQAKQIYVRIEGFNFRKIDNKIFTPVSYWLDKEDVGNASKQIINTFIDYTEDSQGKEITVPNNFNIDLYEEVEKVTIVYETVTVKEEVPYVSFDENGDEITKYREVEVEKEVETGSEKIIEKVKNIKLIQEDIFSTIYNGIKKELSQYFKEELINKD